MDTTEIKLLFSDVPLVSIERTQGKYDTAYYEHFIFKIRNTSIRLFKKMDGFYIENACIYDKSIRLINNCCVGMSKIDFFKYSALPFTDCNALIVSNEDQTMTIKYVFNNDMLQSVIAESADD